MSLVSKRLRKASYNGVGFNVTSASVRFGRRTVTHEYPQRDSIYSEDLGKSARVFDLTGFIVGDTYVSQTKRLLKVLEASNEDNEAGKLVHPWLGTVRVYLNSQPKVDWNLEKGVTNVSLSFIEAGSLDNPSIVSAWGDKLRSAVDDFMNDALEAFGMSMQLVEGVTEMIDEIASGEFLDLTGILEDSSLAKLFDLGDACSNLGAMSAHIMSQDIKSLGSSIIGVLGLGSYANSKRNWSVASKAVIDTLKKPALKKKTELNTRLEEANDNIVTLTRRVMLANLAGTLSLVGTKLDISDEDNDDIEIKQDIEIRELRNQALNLLIEEQNNLGTDENELYNIIDDVIINTYRYLTDNVLEDSYLIDFTPKIALPALVLAYDKYADATRADEIVRRNNVVNPLFLPAKTLKIKNE